MPWPPPGLTLRAAFAGAAGTPLEGLSLTVVYELYVGVPALSKWLLVSAAPGSPAASSTLDGVQVERLGLNQPFSPLAPMAYATQYVGPTPPTYPGSGKLGVLVDYHYAGWVNWTNDDLVDGTAGSSQPLLSVTELGTLRFGLRVRTSSLVLRGRVRGLFCFCVFVCVGVVGAPMRRAARSGRRHVDVAAGV